MRVEKTLKVRIPPGVATGQYMTLRGAGNVGPPGGPRGDILLVFDVADDPGCEWDGEDLYAEVLVTFPQLVVGADLEVPAVSGSVSLRVPSGTQSGQVFHLRGRGLPRINASGVGDLHVRVQLWTPDRLSAREEQLVRELAELQKNVPQGSRSKGFWTKMKEALGT